MRPVPRLVLVLLLAACAFALLPSLALAGPGGKIATVVFKSFWGKLLLAVLFVVLFPVIAYVVVKERLAERRTLRDLKRLAAVDPRFDWLGLKERISECFHRVHSAWRREDMAQACEWMTSWYWQNQQLVHLDDWAAQGLVNTCRVTGIKRVRMLFVACRNEASDFEGSRVVAAIDANMEDYLADRVTGNVVSGEKGFKDVDTVWTFVLDGGAWRVSNIEEGTLSLVYARLPNEVPAALPAAAART